jgi:uncharacterized protein (DUF1778 family)
MTSKHPKKRRIAQVPKEENATIAANEQTLLQLVDHASFFAALDSPPAPTNALREAFRRHRVTVISADLEG